MPIYEYRCLKCEKKLEVVRKFSDPPLRVCPECGGALRKLISNTSFVLKGSGWYSDGYSSPSSNGKKQGEAAGKEPAAGVKPEKAGKPETAVKPEKAEKSTAGGRAEAAEKTS